MSSDQTKWLQTTQHRNKFNLKQLCDIDRVLQKKKKHINHQENSKFRHDSSPSPSRTKYVQHHIVHRLNWKLTKNLKDEESLIGKSVVIAQPERCRPHTRQRNLHVFVENRILWSSFAKVPVILEKLPNHKNWSADATHQSKKERTDVIMLSSRKNVPDDWNLNCNVCVDATVILMTIQRWMETSRTIHNTAERHFSNLNRLWGLRRDCPHNK